ncbi:MAG: hypothetical protein ACLRO1_10520 [Agathobaculum sp.]
MAKADMQLGNGNSTYRKQNKLQREISCWEKRIYGDLEVKGLVG